jgi:hypothetical protein
MFLWYNVTSKAYKLWDLKSSLVIVNKNAFSMKMDTLVIPQLKKMSAEIELVKLIFIIEDFNNNRNHEVH